MQKLATYCKVLRTIAMSINNKYNKIMTSPNFKIENNISIPEAGNGRERKYPFDNMNVGDSFEAGDYDRKKMQSLYGSIFYFKSLKGNGKKKFACRKTTDFKMRVWRTA